MNVWLKTAGSRKNTLSRSFVTSESSFKSPLPIIHESAGNEEVYSNSNFSVNEYENESDLSDMEFLPGSQDKVELSIRNRGTQKINNIFLDTNEQRRDERKRTSSSENQIRKPYKFTSSSTSEEILRKRELVNEEKSSSHDISNIYKSRQRMAESMRVIPSNRLSKSTAQTNSKRVMTTGRKNDLREHVISLIEYCSNEVGLACYNMTTGQIKLAQIIERMTYFQTVSTIERFYPQQIIYSNTLESTPLMRKLMEHFRRTSFRPLKRNLFDETKGYYIYTMRGNKNQHNPDNKFLCFAALHALVNFLENSFQVTFTYSALNIKWHFLEEVLIVHSQTIADLEIFLNLETKTTTNTFVQNFKCLTDGGSRMLRANMLQPLTGLKKIQERQDLTQILIENKALSDLLARELIKFKHYEPITAKFIQNPKKDNLKSIKSYLGAIFNLSKLCFEIQVFRQRLSIYENTSKIINILLVKFSDERLQKIRRIVRQNFDEQILKTFQSEKTRNKKQNFIFLFKVDKIEDEFAEVFRVTYSHTVEDILKIYAEIKQKSKEDLKLLHNEVRGYYFSGKNTLNLTKLSETIEDDILQISSRGNVTTFSTSILASMNNRLKQNENKLVFQSESLLLKIIEEIQTNIEALFEVNYWLSMVDMVMSFSNFVKHYRQNFHVEFCRPLLSRTSNRISFQKLRTIWTVQKFHKLSKEQSLTIDEQTKVLAIEKDINSFEQLNMLYSVGFLTILSQIGCLVPAHNYESILFDTLISKINVEGNLQNKMSHFQIELNSLRNILENSKHLEGSRCLVLIDQIVRGSQPEEEWALSLTAVKELCSRSCKSITLVSDEDLFRMLGQTSGVETLACCSSHQKEQESQVRECLAKYNFCPYFIELYKKFNDS